MAIFEDPKAFEVASSGVNTFTRKFGGNERGIVVDPFISGYMFIKFVKIPDPVLTAFSNLYNYALPDTQAYNLLASSCTSVNIPGATINKTEQIGLGGIRSSYVAGGTFDNTVSMKFFEHSGTPVSKLFHAWIRTMRDYRSGVSLLTGGNYTKSNYAGACYYWTTRPDGLTVETYYCLTGLFPMKDPMDVFSGDLGANDKVDIDMEFSCDYVWQEPWVYDACAGFAEQYRSGSFNVTFNNISGGIISDFGVKDGRQ